MSEEHYGRDHLARLLRAMGQHLVFLEGALGLDMKPMRTEDEIVLTETASMDAASACRLMFSSLTSPTGWLDDRLEFTTVDELVQFLKNVELLVRIARAQQRGE
jgi:hypothetical protein